MNWKEIKEILLVVFVFLISFALVFLVYLKFKAPLKM